MRILLILYLIINTSILFSQELKGRVYYYETNGKPVSGIKVYALGCTHAFSKEDGTFTLYCQNKKAGQAIRILIDQHDANGKAIEFVNQDQYEYLALPINPDIYLYEIYIAPLGTGNKRKFEVYQQIVKHEVQPLIDKISYLENKLSLENLVTKKNDEEELVQAKRKLAEEEIRAERLAEQISILDRTRVSSIVNEAIVSIESGENIDKALNILSNEAIINAYNEEKKLHSSNLFEIIQASTFKINLSLAKNNFEEALKSFDILVKIFKENNFSSESIISLYTTMAFFNSLNGDFENALKLQELSYSLSKKIEISGNPFWANFYKNLATYSSSLGSTNDAITYLNKSIEIIEKDSSANEHKRIAQGLTYLELALNYNKKNNLDRAIELGELGLSILISIDSIDIRALALAYNKLSIVYKSFGIYDRSLELALKAVNTYETFLTDKMNLEYATLLHNLASIYFEKMDYANAEKFALVSFEIRNKILTINHHDYFNSYLLLATIHAFQDKLELASNEVNFCIEGFNNKGVFFSNELSSAIQLKAYILSRLGKKEEAVILSHNAVIIREKSPLENTLELANYYANYGAFLQEVDSLEKSLEYQLKGLKIREEILSEENEILENSYFNLSRLYFEMEHDSLDKSIHYFEKAWNIINNKYHANHSLKIDAVNHRRGIYAKKGSSLYMKGDYKDALGYFLDVESENSEYKIISNTEEFSITLLIASCYYQIRNYESAILYFNKTLEVKPNYLVKYYNDVGMCYLKMGDLERAKVNFDNYFKVSSHDEKAYRNYARYHALRGNVSQSIENLKMSIELGFDDIGGLKNDESFIGVIKTKEFKSFLKKAKSKN